MESKVWNEYLEEKKQSGERIKMYLNEKNTIFKYNKETGELEQIKLNNIMLSGIIEDYDEYSIRLKDKSCLIERPNIMTIKSSDDNIKR